MKRKRLTMKKQILAAAAATALLGGVGSAAAATNWQALSQLPGSYAQAHNNAQSVAACNTGHNGDVSAEHSLMGETDYLRHVTNGSRGGCVWSPDYGKKIYHYRVVNLWPGPDDYGRWVYPVR